MKSKISDLTPKNMQIIAEETEYWRAAGLSTEPADFETAERAITGLYKSIGKGKPHFVHLSSPFAAELYINTLNSIRTTEERKDDQLGSQLGDQLWSQLVGQLRSQLVDQLGDQLDDQLGSQLRSQLGSQLGDGLKYNGTWFLGQHDAWLWGFYEAGRKLGVKYSKELNEMLNHHCDLVRSVGWVYPFKDFCILTDRPERIIFDEEPRLHCEDGPAILYRDGYALFSWRGQRIPSKWITDPDTITPEIALTWENIEQRRAACEILGWGKILDQLNAITIDKDGDPQIGELVEVDIPEIGRERFLRVECGTKREFVLPVPPDMMTAIQANSWTYGIDQNVLQQLEVRT